MKLTSIFTAASLVIATAMPAFAQTAPATNGFANVPAVQQVNTQLAAQGYTITNVVSGANGTYTITAVGPNGAARTITINPATGAVTDSIAGANQGGEGMGEGNEGNERGESNERGGSNERGEGGSDNND